jgi:hypothetical protein
VTWYLALGILWRRLWLNLYGMSFYNDQRGRAAYPTDRRSTSPFDKNGRPTGAARSRQFSFIPFNRIY